MEQNAPCGELPELSVGPTRHPMCLRPILGIRRGILACARDPGGFLSSTTFMQCLTNKDLPSRIRKKIIIGLTAKER
ncbi:hypothetical protein TNCT_60741 [Trichonephila clavata]|uniref:Uncharacterized protein n=1 Tax=Trichonephila clavata TaxID=2740835 RepID=A0A8X6F2P9_TRICU|nr:hypothetical protein TNCT_60741 [Trichonephila clavata]